MKMEELTALGLTEDAARKILTFAGRDLQTAETALRETFQSQTQQIQRNAAIENALLRAGAHEPRTVLPLLALEDIVLEGQNLRGLDAQLDAVRKQAGYLFESAQAGAAPVDSGFAHGYAPCAGAATMGEALRDHYQS